MDLTSKQLDTIGYKTTKQVPFHYWNQNISDCFKAFAPEENYQDQDSEEQQAYENQTFPDFIQMDLSGPNADGSSRHSFKNIQEIKFAFIQRKSIYPKQTNSKKSQLRSKKSSKAQKNGQSSTIFNFKDLKLTQLPHFKLITNSISQILTKFFRIPASYDPSNPFSIDSNSNILTDEKQQIQFEIPDKVQVNRKKKQNPLHRPTFDALQLIDLAIEYKDQRNSSKNLKQDKNSSKETIYLYFIEADLVQGDNCIDGRATGDGVAFVSFNREDLIETDLEKYFIEDEDFPSCYSLSILIHQCLHTLGFDHCSGWECLMNYATNNEFLLCPGCVRKLESEIGTKVSMKKWYLEMAKTLKKVKTQMSVMFGKQGCVQIFADALYTRKEVEEIIKQKGEKGKVKQGHAEFDEEIPDKMISDPSSMLQKCLHIQKVL